MSQQKQTPKQVLEKIKKELDIKRLEDFRRADLTSELRERTGLKPEDEFRLMAVVELHRFGLPMEVAEALALSGAIGSAADLPALQAEEVEQILNESTVKSLLPSNFDIKLELVEKWLQNVQALTAEEDAPSREALFEDQEQSVAEDNEVAEAMEDIVLSRQNMEKLLKDFMEQCQRGEAAIKELAQSKEDQIDPSNLRDILIAIKSGIGKLAEGLVAPEKGEFNTIYEDQDSGFTDEGMEPAKEIQALEAELKRIELSLQHLRKTVESGDEEISPAAVDEEIKEDIETPLRGE